MEFRKIQRIVFEEYKRNGYLEIWENASHELYDMELSGIVDIAELGLIVTEVSEAIEEVRNAEREKIAGELADIIIRVMNFASRHNVNLERYVLSKHERNLLRPKIHGRKLM